MTMTECILFCNVQLTQLNKTIE